MGTEIYLKIEGITLDWSKNSMGSDHGFLFHKGDRCRIRSDQIDYESDILRIPSLSDVILRPWEPRGNKICS